MFIIGQGALNRPDSAAVLSLLGQAAASMGVVREGWNGYNVLHTAASRVGGLDMGFVPAAGGRNTHAMLAAAVQNITQAFVPLYNARKISARELIRLVYKFLAETPPETIPDEESPVQ